MQNRNILIFLFIVFILLVLQAGCNKEDGEMASPISILTNCSEGDAFEHGTQVRITIDANSGEKSPITEVKIFIDENEVFCSKNLPFYFDWNTSEEEVGNHVIKIIAFGGDASLTRKAFNLRIYVLNEQPCPCAPTVTDYDGNTYKTIQIGEQCWMKENLEVIHYADGTPLVNGTGAGNTQYDTTTLYYFNYKDDEGFVDTYGRLYIWMAAVNGEVTEIDLNPSPIQGVCPDGWHLPSDSEWKELEMFLGMSEEEARDREWRGTIEGGMLKEQGTTHWEFPNASATNESGFSALPAGHRTMDGNYKSLGLKGSFWSSTNHVAYNMTQNPAFRMVNFEEPRTYRYQGFHGYLTYARSVRCVKNDQ